MLKLTEAELIAGAVCRGCGHCASMAPGIAIEDPGADSLPHELLGCLLLSSDHPQFKMDRFNCFRIGAMVLSDLDNDVTKTIRYATGLEVEESLVYLAQIGFLHDNDAKGKPRWREIMEGLSQRSPTFESTTFPACIFPGVSRLTSETYVWPLQKQRGPVRSWLRTNFKRSPQAQ